MPLMRRIGNHLISGLYNLLFRQHATDLLTGCKGFWRTAIPVRHLETDGFEHSIEFGAIIALRGHHIHDVPVDYQPRTRGASKMRHIPEVLRMLRYLMVFWGRYVLLGQRLPSRVVERPPLHGRNR